MLLSVAVSGQITPQKYYHFQNTLRDSLSTMSLSTTGSYSYVNGTVGKAVSLTSASAAFVGTTLTPSSGWSVQFAYKPSYNFDKYVAQSIIRIGSWEVGLGWSSASTQRQPVFSLLSSTSTQSARWNKRLDGISIGNYKYFNDTSTWKVIAVTYDNASGTARIYVDGKTATTFSNVFGGTANGGLVYINISDANYKYEGLIDEVAFYNAPLDARQVAQNYTDFTNGIFYSATYGTAQTETITAANDSNYYGYGYVVGSQNATTYTNSALTQLSNYKLPRNHPSSTLNRNFNWAQPDYLAGKAQSGNTAAVITASYNIQRELAYNWNYGILAFQNAWAVGGDDSSYFYRWITLANENPTIRTDGITNYAFTSNYLTRQSYASAYYVKNSAGQYINTNGVTTSNKYFDTYSPCAIVDTLRQDGRYIANILRTKLMPRFTTATLDFVNENNEVLGIFSTVGSDTLKLQGGNLQTAKTNSGLDWKTFIATGYKKAHQYYADSVIAATGAAFTIYNQGGYEQYTAKWSVMRGLQASFNGYKYSTPDIYMRWPSNWRYHNSAWHGLNWANVGRNTEISSGDHFFSPFVSAGWSVNPEEDMNSVQYLGIMKVLSGFGAEFFFAGYFQEGQLSNPKHYVWQVVMPSYAQAVNSRIYSDYLNSTSVVGDILQQDDLNPTDSSLLFYAGDKRKAVSVRKVTGKNMWLIYSNLNGVSNAAGEVEDSSSCTIKLGTDTLTFYTRPQGSCYVWNKDSAVFYQLDGWHERKHPERWSNKFYMEGELADNTVEDSSTYTKVGSNYNFTNFQTHIVLDAGDTAKYTFKPRNNVPYYVHIRCSGTSVKLITNSGVRTLSCLGAMNWVSACSGVKIRLNVVDTGTIQLVNMSGTMLLDKMYFTTDSTESFSTSLTCAITGATNFCTTTDLTATSAASYLWTGGTTTQTKTISASGTYTVTITDNLGNTCSISHTAVQTTVSASISGTATVCYGASTTLTASAGTAYLWSTGATTSSISATAATYTVTVYQGACTGTATFALSQYAEVTPTISGLTSVCSGSTTTLTSTAGSSYLWSTGGTNQSVAVGQGTYTVTVTQGACTGTDSHIVTQQASVNASISGATSVCLGQTTTITASAGTSYLWSDASVTQSITVGAGNYTVTVTQGVCTGSATHNISTGTITASISGVLGVCYGTSTTITASGGATYLWSTGSTDASISASAGNYTVTATLGACTATSSATVYSYAQIVPIISGASSVCAGELTPLTSTGSVFLWSNGNTTSSINASVGTYTVTVTEGACTGSATKVITTSASITPTITGTTTFCSTTSLSVGSYDAYSWSSGATTQSATISASGTYTVTVTQGACTGTATVVCTKLPDISLTISGSESTCLGSYSLLSVGTFSSYLWSSGATTSSIFAVAGTYTVTVTQGGCTASASYTVSSATNPTPTITGDSLCGASVTLSTGSFTSYFWSTGATTQTASATKAGTYTVTVTGYNGCTGTATYNVVVCSAPKVTNLQSFNVIVEGKTVIKLTWDCTLTPRNFEIEITKPDGTIKYRTVSSLSNSFTFGWCARKLFKFRVRAISGTTIGAWSNYATNQRCSNPISEADCN